MKIECKKCMYFNERDNEFGQLICVFNPERTFLVDYDDACLNFMPLEEVIKLEEKQ